MAEDTLELVRKAIASWERGDEELMRRVFHPDAVFIDHSRPDALEFRGYEGFVRAYRSWIGTWQEARLDSGEPSFIAPGLAVASGRMSGIAKTSKIPVERSVAGLYWVAGGRVLRLEIFGSEDAARKAAARLA